jgi:hypothetical protein
MESDVIKLKTHYSGKQSRAFWKHIDTFYRIGGAWDEAYQLGVLLQNMESFVLKRLDRLRPS